MAVLKVPIPEFSLTSTWTNSTPPNYGTPSWKVAKKDFAYSLPSGAKIKKSQIWITVQNPNTGWSVLNVSKNRFTEKSGSERGANITLSGNSGTFQAEFNFKANGNKNYNNGKQQSSKLTFKNVYLLIEYEGVSAEPASTPPAKNEDVYEVPPQSVGIFDETSNGAYLFDGVQKIQHNASVKLEEEPDKHKDEYVNNARNEPDKVVIDVVMSDVYSGDTPNTSGSALNSAQSKAFSTASSGGMLDFTNSRSTLAYQTFHWLKEQRRKLTLITPQYIYVNMIISAMTVTHDDSCPFGWQGQITFQSAFQTKEQQQNKSTGKATEVQPPSPSMLSGIIRW